MTARLVRLKSLGTASGFEYQGLDLDEVLEWFKVHATADGTVEDEIRLFLDGLIHGKTGEPAAEHPWVFSDFSLDRDKERIDPAGWQVKNYRLNPVVLWSHLWWEPAIGISSGVRVREEKLVGRVKFDTGGSDGQAIMIAEKVAAGVIRCGSVGFQPIKVELIGDGEEEAGKKKEEARLIHRKQELMEFSACNIPSNVNAMMMAEELNSRARGTKHYVLSDTRFHPEPKAGPREAKDESPSGFDMLRRVGVSGISARELEESIAETEPPVQKPYPNEHACRLRAPDEFEADSFRRTTREHEGKKYSVISGKLKGENTMTEQAYRYEKETWKETEARKHCKEHDGAVFEPASEDEAVHIDGGILMSSELEGSIRQAMALVEKGVIPYKDLGAAAEATDWDAGAEVKAATVEELKLMCAWYDAEAADAKGSYKLPHHRQSDKKAVWKGVAAAMAVLLGARGGADIPDADRKSVYDHLAKHYAQWDKEPPEFRNALSMLAELSAKIDKIKELMETKTPPRAASYIDGLFADRHEKPSLPDTRGAKPPETRALDELIAKK